MMQVHNLGTNIRVLQDKARITGVMNDGEFWKRPAARAAKAVAAE